MPEAPPLPVAPPPSADGRDPAATLWGRRRFVNVAGRLAALVVVYGFFAVLTPASKGFLSEANTQLMLQDISVVAMAAIGATLVIVAGGIDLSVGSTVALSMIACAYVLHLGPHGQKILAAHPTLLPIAAVGAAAAMAALVGVLNGVLVTSLRLVPFIVTLGTMQMARGLTKFISREQNIYPSESVRDLWIANLLDSPRTLFTPPFLPMAVWLVILAAVLAHLFLRYTRPGRHLFAIGSNEKTAILCGVPVRRTKILVYALGGLFSGLAGIIFFARLGAVAQPTEAVGYELLAIAAAVIGGASLLGGRGTVLGTMIGALIITVLRNGGVKMGWPQYVQEFVTGAVIIAAVAIDNLRNRPKN